MGRISAKSFAVGIINPLHAFQSILCTALQRCPAHEGGQSRAAPKRCAFEQSLPGPHCLRLDCSILGVLDPSETESPRVSVLFHYSDTQHRRTISVAVHSTAVPINFFSFPSEIRNKIYEEALVLSELIIFVAAPYRIFQGLEALTHVIMIRHGLTINPKCPFSAALSPTGFSAAENGRGIRLSTDSWPDICESECGAAILPLADHTRFRINT